MRFFIEVLIIVLEQISPEERMKRKTQFFRVAAEGIALNGLEITPEMINDAVKNLKKYTATVNFEHLRSYWGFSKIGEVIDARAAKFSTENGEKLGLEVQIEAYDNLVNAFEAGQKTGWSAEFTKSPDVDGWILFGLAATDSPASLYTQKMEFSLAQKDEGLIYSDYIEQSPEFIKEQEKTSLFSRLFSQKTEIEIPTKSQNAQEYEAILMEFAKKQDALSQDNQQLAQTIAALESKVQTLESKFSILETTPASPNDEPQQSGVADHILVTC